MNNGEQDESLPKGWREVEHPPEAAAVAHLIEASQLGERIRSHFDVSGERPTFSTNDLRSEYDEMGEHERIVAKIATHLWSGAFRVDLRKAADELSSADWEAVCESLVIYRNRKRSGS